tara:strand:- start:171 stop:1388 length:1218 start_codon:yes stop_codon:yes gene_type:complete
MDLHFKIINKEDIEYLQKLDEKEKNNILQSALSIGLKSINMGQLSRDSLSYINPIKELIKDENSINTDNIQSILDILQDTLKNSNKKGRFGEMMAINLLIKKYPSWKIEDTANINHSGDCQVFINEYGRILYELKTYTTNVNNEEIIKFKRDIDETNSNYGIFISQTSGIVGKNMVEYELYNNKILVYICNTGLNGLGMEIGTEFLLSLIKSKIADKRYFVRDIELNNQLKIINDKLYDLTNCISNFSKLKVSINDAKSVIINQFDMLYKNCYDYEIKGNLLLNEIIENINIINEKKDISLQKLNFEIYIIKLEKKHHIILYKLNDLCKKYNIDFSINDEVIYLVKNDSILAKLFIKTKIELCFNIEDLENINFNAKYERFKNDMLCIHLLNEDKIWYIIENKFK